MKYKELLEQLKKLSDQQLECDVVFCSEEISKKISRLDTSNPPLYYDPEYPEDGCFELNEGQNADELKLAYKSDYPMLVD